MPAASNVGSSETPRLNLAIEEHIPGACSLACSRDRVSNVWSPAVLYLVPSYSAEGRVAKCLLHVWCRGAQTDKLDCIQIAQIWETQVLINLTHGDNMEIFPGVHEQPHKRVGRNRGPQTPISKRGNTFQRLKSSFRYQIPTCSVWIGFTPKCWIIDQNHPCRGTSQDQGY